MEKIPRAIYTKELREEAVKLVTKGGLSMSEVIGFPLDDTVLISRIENSLSTSEIEPFSSFS